MTYSQRVSATFPLSAAIAFVIVLIAALLTFDNLLSWSGLIGFLIWWLAVTVIIAFAWAGMGSGSGDGDTTTDTSTATDPR